MRWLHRSALLRFSLLFTLIFAAGFAVAFGLAYQSVSTYTASRVRDTIETDLRGFRDIFTESKLEGLKTAVTQRSLEPKSARVYLLVSAEGEKIAGNFDSWPNNLASTQSWTSFRDAEGAHVFDGAAIVLPGDIRLLIAHDRAEHDALLKGLRRELTLPALLALVAALLAGYLVSRGILARINALNATCRAVEGGDISARAADTSSDEFGQLARSVNAMLARISVLMRSVHVLSDHVAHEMRTPLSRLRSRLETARRQLAAAQSEPTVRAIAEDAIDTAAQETHHIVDMFNALLDITAAEAAAGDSRGLKPVDLARTIAEVVDLYEAVAEEKQVVLVAQTNPARILGEEVLLMRLVANVVDNAIKFTPPQGKVSISLNLDGSDAVMTIADSGPGIADEFRAAAFERFARAQEVQQVPGHGLGLTLVRAIALRHGMKVMLEDNQPGLRVVFRATLTD